jgi:hypothetical protein
MRLRYLAIALVLSAAFATDSLAQSKQPTPTKGKDSQPVESQTKNPKGQPSTDERGTDKVPLAIKIVPAPKTEAEAEAEAKDRDEKATLDRKLVWFTGLLVIVGFLQFVAIGVQAVFLWLSFKESRKSTDVARDAMIAGERAFVFATAVLPFWEFDEANSQYNWRFRPQWQNSGDTPTRNMVMNTECLLTDDVLPPGFDFEGATVATGTALLPPNSQSGGGLAPRAPAPAITPQDILEVQLGKKILWLFGWARYHDVFPGTPEHITKFCWRVVILGDPVAFDPKVNEQSLKFPNILHTEGNCADDECKKYGPNRPDSHVGTAIVASAA